MGDGIFVNNTAMQSGKSVRAIKPCLAKIAKGIVPWHAEYLVIGQQDRRMYMADRVRKMIDSMPLIQ